VDGIEPATLLAANCALSGLLSRPLASPPWLATVPPQVNALSRFGSNVPVGAVTYVVRRPADTEEWGLSLVGAQRVLHCPAISPTAT